MSPLVWLLLLLIVAGVAWAVLRNRSTSRPSNTTASLGGRDDLTSLGLSEVRPREAGAPAAQTPDTIRAGGAAPRPATAPPRPAAEAARPARSAADGHVRPDPALWPDGADAARHLLASLAASVGGAAGVLRYDEDTDAYVAEAVAGMRLPTPLPANRCPLHRAPQDGQVTLLDGPSGMGSFTGTVLVRALAPAPAERAFLVVAPKGDADSLADRVGAYADLLANLSDLSVEDGASAAPPPRATIIEDEQEAARAEGRPLAFALVTLAEAEEILTRNGSAEVADAERRLRERLGEHAAVRRTEPFGDLLVGVFLDLEPEGVAAWCESTSASAPALFIGAVAPVDGDASDVRAAAAAALHDAYDQQRAQVVPG